MDELRCVTCYVLRVACMTQYVTRNTSDTKP